MKFNIELIEENENEIVSKIEEKIKEKLTPEIIEEEIYEYLEDKNTNILYLIHHHMNLYERYQDVLKLIHKDGINSIDNDDRMIMALYSLMNDRSRY